MSSAPAGRGLEGVVASPSAISFVDGTKGQLLYRGYNILDLAEHSTFEEVCWLLWHGELPTPKELEDLRLQLGQHAALPRGVVGLLQGSFEFAPHHAPEPMDALRTALSSLGLVDPPPAEQTVASNLPVAVKLVARTPTLVGAYQRLREGQEPVAPKAGASIAENLLRGLTGKEPGPQAVRAMDVALILHADHEFNASTFTARVVASTLADMVSAVTAAMGALKGPLHGGANQAVMKALKQVGSPDNVEPWIKAELGAGRKIFGFGHRVYKTMDPRAIVLKRLSERVGRETSQLAWFEMSQRMEQVVMREKKLNPNVDFYSASLYHTMGIPDDLFTAIFAVSRMSGWTAHVLEQYGDNRLIRPRADYTGPKERPFPRRGPS
ncbi:MAG TPA: citrate/2-methylcitrate synthase [Candidatus Thermoplasmatota archaeon]|jgi:citrate synthase|nr:citrate/2-methylcitrate synthase [Candidatus Thermoplasmatota archaeon]